MPIFDYKCTVCATETDKLMKRDDPPPTCPEDEEHGPMKRKLSAPSVSMGIGDGVEAACTIPRINPYYG